MSFRFRRLDSGSASPAASTFNLSERTRLLDAEKAILRSLRGDSSEDLSSCKPEASASSSSTSPPQSSSKRTLGTFEGVFAPVSMSMLSSILFLRVGFIVGNAGLLEALLQFGLAYVILVCTVLSICAIATNGAVEGGGVYFMISRTLGLEFGVAIGVLFWLANVVSSALYIVACTEGIVANFAEHTGALHQVLPTGSWWNLLYSTAINFVNLVVCLVGAKLFGRTTVVIFATVVCCAAITIVSFVTDNSYEATFVYNSSWDCVPPTDNSSIMNCTKAENGSFTGLLSSSWPGMWSLLSSNALPKFEFDCSSGGDSDPVHFFSVFGVLFSGVTGIMTGANMSGELIAPAKSIPRGTLWACFFTFSIFTSLSVLTALTCNPTLLLHDCLYMSRVVLWKPVVAVGVLLATFSASLNNLIGASRVLEAVARDVLQSTFLKFAGSNQNPIVSVLITWTFVELFLLQGSLNDIAQMASVLFLLSYGAVNLACLGLNLSSAPNFRPSFRFFSWQSCLLGLAGTSSMMFLVNPLLAAVAVLLCLSLVLGLNVAAPLRDRNYGSISQALIFHQVRKYLLLLDPRKAHVKFWRPQVLLLVSTPRSSCALIDFCNALKKSGLYVVAHVYTKYNETKEEEDQDDLQQKDLCNTAYYDWLRLVDHLRVKAFVELTSVPSSSSSSSSSLRQALGHVMRMSGIGAMKPNTVVLGFRDETFHSDDLASPQSPYKSDAFDGVFPDLRAGGEIDSPARIGAAEFVGVVVDALNMDKNVCICRHFQKLNKAQVFRGDGESIFGTRPRKKLYLDAWLVDFLSLWSGDESVVDDTTSLFLLQLVCIVNMVPRWKKLQIRVFIATKDNETLVQEQQRSLSQLLELLRIRAQAHVLHCSVDEEYGRDEEAFLAAAAQSVKERSAESAVTFLYMAKPPKDESEWPLFLSRLTTLTSHWPPTVLVRGVSPVTSTTM